MNPMFYFLIASTAVLAVTPEPVLDTDGEIIFDGSYYAISPSAPALKLPA